MRQARKIKGSKTIALKQVADKKTMNKGDLMKQAKKILNKLSGQQEKIQEIEKRGTKQCKRGIKSNCDWYIFIRARKI